MAREGDIMRQCDLCGGSGYEVICRDDRAGEPLITVACAHCGLVGHERIPTEGELAQYYANSYRQEYHGEETPSDRRILRAWNKGQRVLRRLTPWLANDAQIFEVGAGIGCNVKSFEFAGFAAAGIEPGTGFQRFSAEKLKARIDHCSVFDLPDTPQHDVVLLIHVIEHFRSPLAALRKIHRILRPGGQMYLECPSLDIEYNERRKMFHFAHIHTFSPRPMSQMLHRAGFVVKQSFSSGAGGNFALLLKRVEPDAKPIPAGGLGETLDILQRNHRPLRRIQGDYLQRRLGRLWMYASEFLWSRGRVRRLLDRCEAASAPSASALPRAA
jgi:SAM-dependent methyltransferase